MPRENLSLLTSFNLRQDGAHRGSLLSVFSLNVIYQYRSSMPRAKANCRNIDIPLLVAHTSSTPQLDHSSEQVFYSKKGQQMARIEEDTKKALPRSHFEEQPFPFLSLPFELRLKIYTFVLPSRTHSIVTQYPHNGYYYSGTSMVSHSTQTLYPAQPNSRPPLPDQKSNLTTYKLLGANFHKDFPGPSIFPEILRSCKQIRDEAEPVMYGTETVFDFGVYVDAVVPFLKDRSALARRAIKQISIAREIPVSLDVGQHELGQKGGEVNDILWSTTSAFLRDECMGLRTVNLTLWGENGGLLEELLSRTGSTPKIQDTEDHAANPSMEEENDNERALHVTEDWKLWCQWEWTRSLLTIEALRHVKVTWWGFAASKSRAAKFDGWLARRMVADKLVRDRILYGGDIIEGVTVVPGNWYE